MNPAVATNLKIIGTVIVTLGVYTWVANAIPQLESDVPEEVTFSEDVSAEELVSTGEDLFAGAGGCTACHGLGTRAPQLREDYEGEGPIGSRCSQRVEGMSCKEYLYESMTDPSAYMVEGFPPIMPPAGNILSNNQLWAIIAYLESLGGEVTVTAEDIQGGGPGGESGGGGSGSAEDASGAGSGGQASAGSESGESPDAMALMQANACMGCHTLDGQGMEIGPTFDGIGSRRSADHIRRSIVEPNAEVAEGYESVAGSMPPNFGELLSDAELDAIVDFLASQTEGGGA